MLTRFEVRGFKAFKDTLVFDLRARDYSFNPQLIANGTVKNALIYGPNGIGKSCLGFALFDLIEHLTDKKQFRDSYLAEYLNTSVDAAIPICFRYFFNFDGHQVVYEYQKNSARALLFEQLTIDGKRCVRWNFFDKNDCDLADLKLQIDLSDNKLSVIKYIRRNIPTGTVPLLDRMMAFVDGMLWYRSLSEGNTYAGFTNGKAAVENAICTAGKIDEFCRFLRDNGLDYSLSAQTVDNEQMLTVKDPQTGRISFFSNVASTGTKTLMLFFYWKITSFQKLTFLFIDEFDAFFHFQSAAAIVKLLAGVPFQVLLTSHNTYLMQNKFTRPDCCFLMSPGKIRNLPDCTDREIREAHNLEKMYQNGAFSE